MNINDQVSFCDHELSFLSHKSAKSSFLDGVAVVILGFCSFVNFILFTQFVKSSSSLSTYPPPSTFP